MIGANSEKSPPPYAPEAQYVPDVSQRSQSTSLPAQAIGPNAMDSAKTILGMTPNHHSKAASRSFRGLTISVVNPSAHYMLEYAFSEFYSGKFIEKPQQFIMPGQAARLGVQNSALLAGVTGGVVFQIRTIQGQCAGYIMFTFSNPSVGNLKGRVQFFPWLTPVLPQALKAQYESMTDLHSNKNSTRVTFYQETTNDFVVLFKDDFQVWE